MSQIKYRVAHRVIIQGKSFEQDDFLPEDLDKKTLEQLKLSHAVYIANPSTADEVGHAEEAKPVNSDAPQKRSRK